MKKIIAISVMFALIAGAVFADSSIGGYVETRFSLAKQTGAEDADPVMGGSIANAYLNFSGSNTEGTLGGTIRLRGEDMWRDKQWIHKAFVWWKPVQQVRIFLGIEQDGQFDTTDFLGWGYHTGDNDYLFNHHWDFWRQIFPGNWDGFGLAFSFYPIPGLDLNLVLPTGGINWPQATKEQVEKSQPITNPDGDTYTGMIPGRLRFSGNYALEFGKISFAYIGGVAAKEKGGAVIINSSWTGYETIDADNNGLFGLSFLLTAIEGIQIKLGGSVLLNTDSDMLINGGFGIAWAGEGFGVKARAGLVTQGDKDMFITGSVMPYFAVGEKGNVLVDIGVSTLGDWMGWFVTPAYRLGIEGGAFKIGLQVYSNNIQFGGNISLVGENDYVKWNVPMSLSFSF